MNFNPYKISFALISTMIVMWGCTRNHLADIHGNEGSINQLAKEYDVPDPYLISSNFLYDEQENNLVIKIKNAFEPEEIISYSKSNTISSNVKKKLRSNRVFHTKGVFKVTELEE